MGERRINGRMLEAKAATSVTLMGSTTIDLRGIQVPATGLRLELVAIMGETRIFGLFEHTRAFFRRSDNGRGHKQGRCPLRCFTRRRVAHQRHCTYGLRIGACRSLNLVDKHGALARRDGECFFLFAQHVDSKIV